MDRAHVGPGRGTVALVGLDPGAGHEQRGLRPCVIVSDPEIGSQQRYPMVCVVPLTRTATEGALYPRLSSRSGGLRERSFAQIDQLRSVDKRRVTAVFGGLAQDEIDAIDDGLRLYLGLDENVDA